MGVRRQTTCKWGTVGIQFPSSGLVLFLKPWGFLGLTNARGTNGVLGIHTATLGRCKSGHQKGALAPTLHGAWSTVDGLRCGASAACLRSVLWVWSKQTGFGAVALVRLLRQRALARYLRSVLGRAGCVCVGVCKYSKVLGCVHNQQGGQ